MINFTIGYDKRRSENHNTYQKENLCVKKRNASYWIQSYKLSDQCALKSLLYNLNPLILWHC